MVAASSNKRAQPLGCALLRLGIVNLRAALLSTKRLKWTLPLEEVSTMSYFLTAEEIVPLLNEIWDRQSLRQPYQELVDQLQAKTQVQDIDLYLDILFNSDHSVKYVAERIALAQMPVPKLNRARLIELVEKIMLVKGSEAEIDTWVDWFEANVPHPASSNLIYYPQQDEEGMTAQQIVDKALNYKPMIDL